MYLAGLPLTVYYPVGRQFPLADRGFRLEIDRCISGQYLALLQQAADCWDRVSVEGWIDKNDIECRPGLVLKVSNPVVRITLPKGSFRRWVDFAQMVLNKLDNLVRLIDNHHLSCLAGQCFQTEDATTSEQFETTCIENDRG